MVKCAHSSCQFITLWQPKAVILHRVSFLCISSYLPHIICVPGLVPKQQKKTSSNKDTKRSHQSLSSGTGPVVPQPQIQPQVVQCKPAFVPPPPVHVSVPSLDSSQLLSSGFDPLAQFMNPHLTQSNSEPNPTITAAGTTVVSGLLNANTPTGQTVTETHPFLNQHPIIPSPGMYTSVSRCATCISVVNFSYCHNIIKCWKTIFSLFGSTRSATSN